MESDLCANVRIFALMNVSSHYWSPFHANDFVFSRNEQQKVYSRVYCSLNKKPLRWRYHFAVVEYRKLTGKKFDYGSPILFTYLS